MRDWCFLLASGHHSELNEQKLSQFELGSSETACMTTVCGQILFLTEQIRA